LPTGQEKEINLIVTLNKTHTEDSMELKEYFEQTHGRGVLATADSDGKVDADGPISWRMGHWQWSCATA
jgi:hypothetical protein